MAKWLYSYRDDLPKGLFKITAEECKKSRLPVDVRISALVPQLSFAGKLIVTSQIRLFSQTKSVQEKHAACITSINQVISIL